MLFFFFEMLVIMAVYAENMALRFSKLIAYMSGGCCNLIFQIFEQSSCFTRFVQISNQHLSVEVVRI